MTLSSPNDAKFARLDTFDTFALPGECIESGESGWRMSVECIESGKSGWRMWANVSSPGKRAGECRANVSSPGKVGRPMSAQAR